MPGAVIHAVASTTDRREEEVLVVPVVQPVNTNLAGFLKSRLHRRRRDVRWGVSHSCSGRVAGELLHSTGQPAPAPVFWLVGYLLS
jgi:hypothetical protein